MLIIANLPGMLDSNVGPRFPEWYIQDWMRYDLEALGVERLTVLAPSKGDFAIDFLLSSMSLKVQPVLMQSSDDNSYRRQCSACDPAKP